MSQQSHNQNLANLVAEAIDAEAAGVFAPTNLDMAAVLGAQTGNNAAGSTQFSRRHAVFARFVEKAMVGLPLAACLGIVIGIAAMSGEFSSNGSSIAMLGSNGSSAMQACDMQVFARCLTGPGQVVPAGCSCVDLDDDGDVDLSDMGSYQQLASMSR